MHQKGDTRELAQMASLFGAAFKDWKAGRSRPATRRETEIQRRAREAVWKLRRAYEDAVDADAGAVVRDFFANAPSFEEMREAFVAWTNLLEVLVQETEIDYGTAPGRGRIKASQVKAVAIRVLVDQPGLRIPRVPPFLTPLLVEAVVDVAVDAVVLVLNRNSLWEPAPRGPFKGGFFTWVFRSLLSLGRRFMRWAPIVRLGDWLRRVARWWVFQSHPVSPAVQAALDRISRTEGATLDRVLRRKVKAVEWIADNARAVVALVDVVAVAVQEAEWFASLSGREKKEFVTEMVVEFLYELELIGGDGTLSNILARRVLDMVIDAVHSVFDRRSPSFGKRAAPRVAVAVPA